MKRIPALLFQKKTNWLLSVCGLLFACSAMGQAELQPWGNLTGIRVQGELMALDTRLAVAGAGKSTMTYTEKEAQRPTYQRTGRRQLVSTRIGSIALTETVTDSVTGTALISVNAQALADTTLEGLYFCLRLPAVIPATGSVQRNQEKPALIRSVLPVDSLSTAFEKTTRIEVRTKERWYIFSWKKAVTVQLRRGAGKDSDCLELQIPFYRGALRKGDSSCSSIYLTARGTIDDKTIHVALNTKSIGRTFDGFGGNFRLQNLRTDPQVIDYCLNHMRVAWGRVEMPWRFWHPVEQNDPLVAARAGTPDSHVVRAMIMAKQLADRHIPLVLTAWFPPEWAITGKAMYRHEPGTAWGNPLNQDSAQAIYQSITAYIRYLKENYGITVTWFSFNESDLGINIRQTGAEHAKLIRELGKYFLDHGLATKLLLGDNSDATTYQFIDEAMADSACRPYIGAVSFHSWRGCDSVTLQHWKAAANKLDVPLLVGEGSIDAAAWAYPAIFNEPVYAMTEIALYIKLMALCQPVSILQWQLTADYSPLSGAGIFGSTGPLTPTWRFWNLKQLAATPKGLRYIPATTDRPSVTVAALGDSTNRSLTVHLVNQGAARPLVLSGIPDGISAFQVFISSASKSMQSLENVKITAGQCRLTLPAGCFLTLISDQQKQKNE